MRSPVPKKIQRLNPPLKSRPPKRPTTSPLRPKRPRRRRRKPALPLRQPSLLLRRPRRLSPQANRLLRLPRPPKLHPSPLPRTNPPSRPSPLQNHLPHRREPAPHRHRVLDLVPDHAPRVVALPVPAITPSALPREWVAGEAEVARVVPNLRVAAVPVPVITRSQPARACLAHPEDNPVPAPALAAVAAAVRVPAVRVRSGEHTSELQ